MDWRQLILGREHVPELTRDSVHVWRVSTAAVRQDFTRCSEILSPEELARAARFHFDKDRRSFVVCRGTLRHLLAGYSGDDPAAIRFCYGLQGKPALAQSTCPDLRFNVSHSGDIALLAFSLRREVGVDVEQMRDDVDFADLAKNSFSTVECDAVLASSPATRANLFYEYWSCKEACIKADGRGLSAPLDQFTVVEQPDNSQWRRVVSTDPGSLSPDLRIRILAAGEGYAAAVAANGQDWNILQFYLPTGEHL